MRFKLQIYELKTYWTLVCLYKDTGPEALHVCKHVSDTWQSQDEDNAGSVAKRMPIHAMPLKWGQLIRKYYYQNVRMRVLCSVYD